MREFHVGALEVMQRRDDVHGAEPFDRLRRVERQAVRDAGAAVMRDDPEALEAESAHQRHHVRRHGALGIGARGRRGRRLGGQPVAAQVRADHGEAPRQGRRDLCHMACGLRIAVQQQQRRAVAAAAEAEALPSRLAVSRA